ncbi:MAG: hypothetical protein QXG39_04170 [Candidatus Aenigmatarchaeota archaeon]
MSARFIGVRKATKSGGSLKVTIPINLVEEFWGKRLEDSFLLCFFLENKKVVIERIEEVLEHKEDYPPDVIIQVEQEYLKQREKLYGKIVVELDKKLAEGRITKEVYDAYLKRIFDELLQNSSKFKKLLTRKELHFIKVGDVNQYIISLFTKLEEEKEEDFKWLISEVNKLKNEVTNLEDMLASLEERYRQGKLKDDDYKVLKDRYCMQVILAKKRIEKLVHVLSGSN